MRWIAHGAKFFSELPSPLDASQLVGRAEGIDFLRALLALWVLASHLLPWVAITTGRHIMALPIKLQNLLLQTDGETHPAVLGFIVLSGYCIHRHGFRRHATAWWPFLIRRFFRIVPIYLVASLVGLILFSADLLLNPDSTMLMTGTSSITPSCLLVKFTGTSVFFPALHQCSFEGNAPLTTVIVEIWLYLAYALAALVILRLIPSRWFWYGLVATWAIAVCDTGLHVNDYAWWHNGSILGFILYWWIGAACVSPELPTALHRMRRTLLLTWSGLTLVLLLNKGLIHGNLFLLGEARQVIFALGWGWLIAYIDHREDHFFATLAPLGRAGYSLYALHAPILIFLLLLGLPWPLAAASVIAVGLVVSRHFEVPLQQYGRHLAARSEDSPEASP